MKCEGCPLKKKQVVMTQEITTGKSYTQDDTGYAWCPAMYETCHLTPDHQRLIKLMISEKTRIASVYRPGVSEKNPDSKLPWDEAEMWTVITAWQERKEGE